MVVLLMSVTRSVYYFVTLSNKVFSCITVTACKENDLFVSHNGVRFRCFRARMCVRVRARVRACVRAYALPVQH